MATLKINEKAVIENLNSMHGLITVFRDRIETALEEIETNGSVSDIDDTLLCAKMLIEAHLWRDAVKDPPEEGENVLVFIERDAYGNRGHYRKKDIEKGWQIDGKWHCDGCMGVRAIAWQKLPDVPPEML